METTTFAPTSNLTTSGNSGIGNLNNNSQIIIHPDHDAGTLKLHSTSQTKSQRLKIEIFLSSVIFVSIILVALLAFIVIPRSQTVIFANSTREVVSNSNEKTEKVNASLDVLYKTLTNQKQSNLTISDSNISDSFVLGIQIHYTERISDQAQNLASILKENFDKKSKVKGFSVPENDPNKEVRNQRTLAINIATRVTGIQEANKQLLDLKNQKVPAVAKTLQDKIALLETKTQKYTDEADKTSKYYVTLSDATISLNNLASSTASSKDINNGISTLTTLRDKFANSKKTDLPEGIEDYNKDIVSVFDLLLNFFKEIKSGKINSTSALAVAYSNFTTQLTALGVTSTNDQLNFWQSNKTLSKWNELSTEHIDLLSSAKKVKDNNGLFLLNWVGIS